jgi:dTDP-L-rhamnose 4-epimerase
MVKNILITGGAGFIGKHTAKKLLSKGYSVTLLDNFSKQIHGDASVDDVLGDLTDRIDLIIGDVRDRECVEREVVKADIIIHLAAETGTGQSMYEVEKYTDINCRGTAVLCDVLTNKNHSVKKLILSSSRSVYGEGKYTCKLHNVVYPINRKVEDLNHKIFNPRCPLCNEIVTEIPTDEQSIENPTSIYGLTKLMQEKLLKLTCENLGIEYYILRFQNVYGEGQSLKNPYTGILSIFSQLALADKPINVFEDGYESRDFIHVRDVVDFMSILIERYAHNGTYNVGSGKSTSVLHAAQLIKDNLKSQSDIMISGLFRVGDIRHNIADMTSSYEEFGWSASTDFDDGIKHYLDWVKSQVNLDDLNNDSYENSLEELKSRGLMK